MSIAIAIGATLFLGAFYSWTSRINGLFFFGRSASADLRNSGEAHAITRQYLTAVLATAVLAFPVAWAGSHLGRNFAALGPLLEAGAFWAFFARANRQVRALELSREALPIQETVLQVPLLEQPSYGVPALFVALLPALLGALAFSASLLLTAHEAGLASAWGTWNASLESHRLPGLFGMSLGLLGSATLLLLVLRTSVRLRTRMAQYSVHASLAMEWIGLALLLAVLGCNFFGVTLNHQVSRAIIVAGVGAALAVTLWNQHRSARFVPPPVELSADDRWRGGLFYVDPNDPALFVQSRCGAGYTLNYGRVLAWPIALSILAYFVAMLFLPIPR